MGASCNNHNLSFRQNLIQFKYEIKSNQKYIIKICRIIPQSFDTKIVDNLEYDENIEKYIDFINDVRESIRIVQYLSLDKV